MNQINLVQNGETALELMKARQYIFAISSRLTVIQICVAVLVPIILATVGAVWQDARPYAAGVALVLAIADAVWIDRWLRLKIRIASKIAERFDCTVLSLQWDRFGVGSPVEHDEVSTAAHNFAARGMSEPHLRDWYPDVAGLSLPMARLVCQRSNLSYDKKLRRSYSTLLLVVIVAIFLALFAVAVSLDLPATQVILLFAPITPIATWGSREFYRQQDAVAQLERLLDSTKAQWDAAIRNNAEEQAVDSSCRQLQTAIHHRRSSSPLVIPGLYKRMRARLEREMAAAAQAWIAEYRAARGG